MYIYIYLFLIRNNEMNHYDTMKPQSLYIMKRL